MLKKLLNLQFFAEGGDGGEGESAEGNTTGEIEVDARIPERARNAYKDAVRKNSAKPEAPKPEVSARPSYEELIKSDDYKEEHKAYMDKTIGDRLKKYKGIESENETMRSALSVVANKYQIDPSSPNFIQDLSEALNSDNSYYEDYAMEHNISVEDAKEIVTLRQNAKKADAERARAEQEARNHEEWQKVLQNAEQTKAKYPEFNLELEMQNPQFARICATSNGDTTAAYWAVHHVELEQKMGLRASQKASQQISQTVAANMARPAENGLSGQASAVTSTDWSKASLSELRAYAESQRRKR